MLKSCSLVLYYPARISVRERDACLVIGMNQTDSTKKYSRNKNSRPYRNLRFYFFFFITTYNANINLLFDVDIVLSMNHMCNL